MSDNPNGLSPLVPGRSGRPSYSLEALRERIERQFHEETVHRADILSELDSEDKRREALREVADYVLAVEAITLPAQEKAMVIESAYRHLFTLGPLEEYMQDESVTTITINGPSDIHLRRGFGKLEPIPAQFEDREHLASLLERLLATGGADFSDPVIEAGVMLSGRAARISVVTPPYSPDYGADIRLHPRQPLRLDDLIARGTLTPPAADLLRAILRGGYGLLIVADAGLGKTTLAGALAALLPDDAPVMAVERAAEMALPPHITRLAATPGRSFEEQFRAALDGSPEWLIVDEIRSDESAVVWEALSRPQAPRYLWVFRGTSHPDRLRSALTMLVRAQHQTLDQRAIHRALAERLPFVAALRLVEGELRLHLIAEWVADEAGDTLVLVPLLDAQGRTDRRPIHPLDLG